MSNRIVEIADTTAHLRFENHLLVIESANAGVHTVPTKDLAAVILSNPRVTLTHGILAGLAEANVAQLLRDMNGSDGGLGRLVGEVRSGDTGHVESTAAQRYWPLLFDDPMFLRRREASDQNRYLNYGYAVLHACAARAIAAIGLNPALGVHHRNKYNAYCLASDLMEPFRVWVDETAQEIIGCHGVDATMTREIRGQLISCVIDRRASGGESRTGADLIQRAAWSLLAVMQGRETDLQFPT